MQTRVFAAHVHSLVNGLRLHELKILFDKIYLAAQNLALDSADKSKFADIAFGVQAYLSSLEGERREIAESLGLAALLRPSALAQLLTTFQSAPNRYTIRGDLSFGDLYESAKALLRLDHEIQKRLISEKLDESDTTYAVVSFEVVDYDNTGVPIARFAEVVQSLDALYSLLDQYLGTQSTARIAYVDSGSDVNIGLKGLAETVSALSDVFHRAWDAIRFRKNSAFERDLDSALRGIQFLDKIRAGAQKGTIDPETAVQLEASVKIRLGRLIGSGVMIEGTPTSETFDKRQVLLGARAQRLLTTGDGPAPNVDEGDELP